MKFVVIRDWYVADRPEISSFTFDDALQEAVAWHETCDLSSEDRYDEEDEEIVFTCSNGWTVREIIDQHGLEVEGNLMGHCVGGYNLNRVRIFSLRDLGNKPHVTMEVDKNNWIFYQIQGKGNEEPIDKYKALLSEWIKNLPGAESDSGDDDWLESYLMGNSIESWDWGYITAPFYKKEYDAYGFERQPPKVTEYTIDEVESKAIGGSSWDPYLKHRADAVGLGTLLFFTDMEILYGRFGQKDYPFKALSELRKSWLNWLYEKIDEIVRLIEGNIFDWPDYYNANEDEQADILKDALNEDGRYQFYEAVLEGYMQQARESNMEGVPAVR